MRCNCENSACSHEPAQCTREAGKARVIWLGAVCDQCALIYPPDCHDVPKPHIGLDYSHGMANVNPETEIHFGIISVHEVDWWWDSTEYVNPPYTCECGMVIEDPTDGDECPDCEERIDLSIEMDCPAHHAIDDDEYSAENDDSMDVWVYKSPYFTTTMYCSPCAPGAGHLGSPHPDGIKTYCLGHEWFDGPAPYPVYSVKTGELVPYKKED